MILWGDRKLVDLKIYSYKKNIQSLFVTNYRIYFKNSSISTNIPLVLLIVLHILSVLLILLSGNKESPSSLVPVSISLEGNLMVPMAEMF